MRWILHPDNPLGMGAGFLGEHKFRVQIHPTHVTWHLLISPWTTVDQPTSGEAHTLEDAIKEASKITID